MGTAAQEKFALTLEHFRRLCSAREYAPADIRLKVQRRLAAYRAEEAADKGLTDENLTDKILAVLTDEGFLSASRYACAFARDKSSLAGWGPVKIRFALRSKGLDEATISDALAQIDACAADEKFLKVLRAKKSSLETDPHIKLKLLKFALSRGYDYGAAAKAVEQVLDNF